jgi:hypothetical protein
VSEAKPKPVAPAEEPALEAKPVKDLEPEAPENEKVRGGIGYGGGGAGGRGVNFSDATLKRDVAPVAAALACLRALRF